MLIGVFAQQRIEIALQRIDARDRFPATASRVRDFRRLRQETGSSPASSFLYESRACSADCSSSAPLSICVAERRDATEVVLALAL